jgi:hypothetical protein
MGKYVQAHLVAYHCGVNMPWEVLIAIAISGLGTIVIYVLTEY